MRDDRATGVAGAALGALLLVCAVPARAGTNEFGDLPLEDLLEVEVYSASKYLQSASDAPGSISVLTADDIRAYGWRTLAQALNSVRGIWVDNDRNYDYVGVRGFGRPGDYNSRVLVLIDGNRLNDPVFDTVGFGSDFALDLELIERIEIVRGAGSSVYGSNAVFGVVNVVTRRGASLQGGTVSAEVASLGTDRERAAAGRGSADGSGIDWLVSASRHRIRGDDIHFPEFDVPGVSDGVARGLDADDAARVYARLGWGEFAGSLAWYERDKEIPTGAFDTAFNVPGSFTRDAGLHLNLGWSTALPGGWTLHPRLFYGRYDYDADYVYADPLVNVDVARAAWWGTELQVLGHAGRHTLVAGIDYQHNLRVDQANFDVEPFDLVLDDRRRSDRSGVYVQDEVFLGARWSFSGGLRLDHYSSAATRLNPRVALSYRPADSTRLKLVYGTAFREPNAYERFYYVNADNLDPESIRSWEFIAEHTPRPNLRLTLDAYHNDIDDLLDLVEDPASGELSYVNRGRARGQGIEFEAERAWAADTRLRASAAWQRSVDRDSGRTLDNSARWSANLNGTTPLFGGAVRLGGELQYLGERRSPNGGEAPARVLAGVALTSREIGGFTLAGGVRNLLDRDNADPGRPEHVQQSIPLDGRTFWLELTWRWR